MSALEARRAQRHLEVVRPRRLAQVNPLCEDWDMSSSPEKLICPFCFLATLREKVGPVHIQRCQIGLLGQLRIWTVTRADGNQTFGRTPSKALEVALDAWL